MQRSIISKSPQCLICELHTPKTTLYKHYIFNGNGKEQLSEEYGCWCYLCARHYYMCNAGVYFNNELERKLKAHAQKRFTEVYPELDFVRIFGENYL